jgi:hypothetical protein
VVGDQKNMARLVVGVISAIKTLIKALDESDCSEALMKKLILKTDNTSKKIKDKIDNNDIKQIQILLKQTKIEKNNLKSLILICRAIA